MVRGRSWYRILLLAFIIGTPILAVMFVAPMPVLASTTADVLVKATPGYTGPLAPLNFLVVQSNTISINATWLKANAASNNTMIRVSIEDYPLTPTDGDLVYYGGNETFASAGYAIENVQYYFTAWGVDDTGTWYSYNYATATIGEELELVTNIIADMTVFVLMLPLAFLSVLAYWKPNAILFLIVAGIAIFSGLAWFDEYVTDYGLAVGIGFIAYAILCLGFAIKLIIWNSNTEVED